MTSIEKMSIRGIRSFSPAHTQVIEFQKPLTLIVGKNGCGKTTIIECLKMATTGQLPPKVSGPYFINDPSIHGGSEVKAQIKLRFKSVLGKDITCVRSFSLAIRGAKREYKAFESALKMYDKNNEVQCLSYKCADLNKLVPEMMGVSHAVLESVVFVHQEESCWPLGDDKSVKEKFDSIFASAEYTKALDEIRKVTNELKTKAKLAKAQLETFEEKMKTVNRLRDELGGAEATQKDLNDQITSFRNILTQKRDSLPALQELLGQKQQLMHHLKQERDQQVQAEELLRSSEQIIHNSFKGDDGVFYEDTEKLKALQEKIGGSRANIHASIEQTENQIRKLESREVAANRKKNESIKTLAEANAVQKQRKELESEINSSLTRLSTTVVGAEAKNRSAAIAVRLKAAKEALAAAVAKLSDEVAKGRQSRDSESSRLEKNLQKLLSDLGTREGEADRKESEARQLELDAKRKQKEAEDCARDLFKIPKLKHDTDRLETEKARSESQTENIHTNKIAELTRDLTEIKQKQVSLFYEMQEVDTESKKLDELEHKKKAADEAEQKVQAAIEEARRRFAAVLDEPNLQLLLSRKALLREVTKVHNEFYDTLNFKQEALDQVSKELNDKLTQREIAANTIDGLNKSIIELETSVSKVDSKMLDDNFNFEGAIRAKEQKLSDKRLEMLGNTSFLATWGKVLEHVDRDRKCGFCLQGCSEDVISSMKTRSADAKARADDPAGETKATEEVRALQGSLTQVKEVQEKRMQLKRKREDELPLIQCAKTGFDEEAQECERKLEQCKRDVEAAREASDESKALIQEAKWLEELFQASVVARQQFVERESVVQSGVGRGEPFRSKVLVIEETEKVNAVRATVERSLENHKMNQQLIKDKQDERNRELAAMKAQLEKLEMSSEQKQRADQEIANLTKTMERLRTEAATARGSIAPLRAQCDKQKIDQMATNKMLQEEVRIQEEKESAAKAGLAELTSQETKLIKYDSVGQQDTFAEMEQLHQRAEQEEVEVRKKLAAARSEKEDLQAQDKNEDALSIQIQQNLNVRENQEILQQRKQAVESAEAALKELRHADRLEERISDIEKKIGQVETDKAKSKGALHVICEEIKRVTSNLNLKGYRSIDKDYREQFIEVTTMMMSVKDLDMYYKALDQSLMAFHKTKMADINKSIGEIWNKTYKGTDIDRIEIKTEHEGTTAGNARKQSYCVMMQKGDAKLPMRGRCSAGQKVLASLVIRLALAETFCLHCGILALDEPTTNLDIANVKSLAEAINDIIKSRRHQSNFQLLVITHDEDFVQLLGRSDNASVFYRVDKRNDPDGKEGPYSTIEQFDIDRFG